MDKELQYSDTILMIRPAHFGFNPETAENNVFQNQETQLSKEQIERLAQAEFDNMVEVLRAKEINVIVIEDTVSPVKTDAIFPNNWFSTHADGHTFLYPMFSPNRRLERREDIIDALEESYQVCRDQSFLAYEEKQQYLEGTGSMILDRVNKIIYACYSERTHKDVLEAFGKKLGYKVVGFRANDENGVPYYHTNVIMTLGEHVAIICTESIEDMGEKSNVLKNLNASNKQIVEISRDQVLQFAGNMLEVKGSSKLPFMIMSEAAYHSLTKNQLHIIKKYNKIVYLPLSTIEKFGGGSARCMMAEIFLPNLNK